MSDCQKHYHRNGQLPFERFNITKNAVTIAVEEVDEVSRQHDHRPCTGQIGTTGLSRYFDQLEPVLRGLDAG